MFGTTVSDINVAFFELNKDDLNELFIEYGQRYGKSAENYARRSYEKWKSGATSLSGKTMERIIELAPPYLSQEQRFELLKKVIDHNKPTKSRRIDINIKDPQEGIERLKKELDELKSNDPLAYLPEHVMDAASWLYADDVTAARSMLAQAAKAEYEIKKQSANKEIQLLLRTIESGQIKKASYTLDLPAGNLYVHAGTPSKCFVASVCFGENAAETNLLRSFRDDVLYDYDLGRNFIRWYYRNGENLAKYLANVKLLKMTVVTLLYIIVFGLSVTKSNWEKGHE